MVTLGLSGQEMYKQPPSTMIHSRVGFADLAVFFSFTFIYFYFKISFFFIKNFNVFPFPSSYPYSPSLSSPKSSQLTKASWTGTDGTCDQTRLSECGWQRGMTEKPRTIALGFDSTAWTGFVRTKSVWMLTFLELDAGRGPWTSHRVGNPECSLD